MNADDRKELRAQAEEAKDSNRYLKPWAVLGLLDDVEKADKQIERARDIINLAKSNPETYTRPEEVAEAIQDALDSAEGYPTGLSPREGQQIVRVETVRIGGGRKVRVEFLTDTDTPDKVVHEHAVKVLARAVEDHWGERD